MSALLKILLILLFLVCPSSNSKTEMPIKIIFNNWSSQLILSEVIYQLFKQYGYPVEKVHVSTEGQWFLLKTGQADIQMEVWEGTMADKYVQSLASGFIVEAGSYPFSTREEWWFPSYVKALCPGLPNWEALNECSDIFATDNQSDKGVYLAGPWEKPDRARIRALGLNFRVKELENEKALTEHLASAYKNKKPILLFNWSPNWVNAVYKGEFVEFPTYSKACETDPGWGLNPNYLYDCGNPKEAWLRKVTSKHFVEHYPCLFKVVTQFTVSRREIEALLAQHIVENKPIEKIANQWIALHKSKYDEVLSNC